MPNLSSSKKDLPISDQENRLLEGIKQQIQKLSIIFNKASSEYHRNKADIEKNYIAQLSVLEENFVSKQEEIKMEYLRHLDVCKAELDFTQNHLGLSGLNWDHPYWIGYSGIRDSSIPKFFRFGNLKYYGHYDSLEIPAILPLVGFGKNILIKASGSGLQNARNTIQTIILKMVATFPASKIRLICIDPVGLGDTVAGFIKDLPDSLTQGRAWTESSHIEQQLTNLEMDMATIKQKFLGRKYSNIEEYNNDAGIVEEPYRILVVSDFPDRFSDSAAQRLISIASNGPSMGVYSIVMINTERQFPYNFNILDLERVSHLIECNSEKVIWRESFFDACTLILDAPPPKDQFISILSVVRKDFVNQKNIEVPFEKNIPPKDLWWEKDAGQEIRFPIGLSGANNILEMVIDEDQLPDALIVGKVGYGKSNLLQIIIDSLALRYSPKELQLFLLDLKQVTFEVYARHRLPHASVIAINTEREFAISVLRKIDKEIKTREDIFRDAGVQSLSRYREKTGNDKARILLIVDEFQELFQDDNIGREADQILERIVRLGRALGVHVILASQTLRGNHSLSNVTKDLIPIRIALQCSDIDARLAMSDDNNEAFLLDRPGEAILNCKNGRIEGNTKFQVFWLENEKRAELLSELLQYSFQQCIDNVGQIIFDGRNLSSISMNSAISDWLNSDIRSRTADTYWGFIGEPIEIKSHISIPYRRVAGRSTLMLGGSDNESIVYSMMFSTIISLAVQYAAENIEISILCFCESQEVLNGFKLLKDTLSFNIDIIDDQSECEKKLRTLLKQINGLKKSNVNRKTTKAHYLFVFGLQAIRKIRHVDAFSIGGSSDSKNGLEKTFIDLCNFGPEYGTHVIAWCDTFRNLERAIGHEGLENFDFRVALQMSSDDSGNFIGNDIASNLGHYRGAFYDVNKNIIEKFRPYNLPDDVYLKNICNALYKGDS